MTNRPGLNDVRTLSVSAAAVYLVLTLAMCVFPGFALSATKPGPGVQPLTPEQARGRDVYVAEGCSYCHTQQVRPLAEDHVWGRPSTRGDYAYGTPELLGTERTGPDLSNVGVRQPSDVWNYIHLYQPRAVVSASIMPAYPWLFTIKDHAAPGDTVVNVPPGFAPPGKVVVATAKAHDLIAYLLSLKQAPLPQGSPAP
jgi:cytochrome c oxidase cbb3-type subunit 2